MLQISLTLDPYPFAPPVAWLSLFEGGTGRPLRRSAPSPAATGSLKTSAFNPWQGVEVSALLLGSFCSDVEAAELCSVMSWSVVCTSGLGKASAPPPEESVLQQWRRMT